VSASEGGLRKPLAVSAAGAADMARPAAKARRTRKLVVMLLRRRGWEAGSMGGSGVLEVGDVAAASAIALAVLV